MVFLPLGCSALPILKNAGVRVVQEKEAGRKELLGIHGEGGERCRAT